MCLVTQPGEQGRRRIEGPSSGVCRRPYHSSRHGPGGCRTAHAGPSDRRARPSSQRRPSTVLVVHSTMRTRPWTQRTCQSRSGGLLGPCAVLSDAGWALFDPAQDRLGPLQVIAPGHPLVPPRDPEVGQRAGQVTAAGRPGLVPPRRCRTACPRGRSPPGSRAGTAPVPGPRSRQAGARREARHRRGWPRPTVPPAASAPCSARSLRPRPAPAGAAPGSAGRPHRRS